MPKVKRLFAEIGEHLPCNVVESRDGCTSNNTILRNPTPFPRFLKGLRPQERLAACGFGNQHKLVAPIKITNRTEHQMHQRLNLESRYRGESRSFIVLERRRHIEASRSRSIQQKWGARGESTEEKAWDDTRLFNKNKNFGPVAYSYVS